LELPYLSASLLITHEQYYPNAISFHGTLFYMSWSLVDPTLPFEGSSGKLLGTATWMQ